MQKKKFNSKLTMTLAKITQYSKVVFSLAAILALIVSLFPFNSTTINAISLLGQSGSYKYDGVLVDGINTGINNSYRMRTDAAGNVYILVSMYNLDDCSDGQENIVSCYREFSVINKYSPEGVFLRSIEINTAYSRLEEDNEGNFEYIEFRTASSIDDFHVDSDGNIYASGGHTREIWGSADWSNAIDNMELYAAAKWSPTGGNPEFLGLLQECTYTYSNNDYTCNNPVDNQHFAGAGKFAGVDHNGYMYAIIGWYSGGMGIMQGSPIIRVSPNGDTQVISRITVVGNITVPIDFRTTDIYKDQWIITDNFVKINLQTGETETVLDFNEGAWSYAFEHNDMSCNLNISATSISLDDMGNIYASTMAPSIECRDNSGALRQYVVAKFSSAGEIITLMGCASWDSELCYDNSTNDGTFGITEPSMGRSSATVSPDGKTVYIVYTSGHDNSKSIKIYRELMAYSLNPELSDITLPIGQPIDNSNNPDAPNAGSEASKIRIFSGAINSGIGLIILIAGLIVGFGYILKIRFNQF